MLSKLAFRNVEKQLGNYLIYFITVSFTVSFMFAVNNLIYSEQILKYTDAAEEFKNALIVFTEFVSVIEAFVLGYATSCMLKLRKLEFGTYLTLGMTRRDIVCLFILETTFLCVGALGTGILFGLFLYQGLMAIASDLLEIEVQFAAYSVKGLLLTVILVAFVFLLSSLASALYLKWVRIRDLIHEAKAVEREVRHPTFWTVCTVLFLLIMIRSCVLVYGEVGRTMKSSSESGGRLFLLLSILALSVVAFHIGLARSIVFFLLRREKFRCRGTNTFVLRQLSSKLSANSVMAGMLAFLLAFSVVGANVSFLQKANSEAILKKGYPFDITLTHDLEEKEYDTISVEEGEQIIEKYSPIQKKISCVSYTTGDNYLHSLTKYFGEGFDGLYDTFLAESDFNRVYTEAGYEPIDLQEGFLIVTDMPSVMQSDFSKAKLCLNGKVYPFSGISQEYPMLSSTFFLAVVPDEAIQEMKPTAKMVSYELENEKIDALALREELTYTRTDLEGEYGVYTYARCDYRIREYSRIIQNSNTAIFVVGMLYIAVIFTFMVMAILALKTLTGITGDREQYRILFRLGAGETEQSRALFRQIFSFFFLPFGVPMLLSIPTGIVCSEIMVLSGYPRQLGVVFQNAALIALVMAAVYLMYFTAAYRIAKKYILYCDVEGVGL